jgi:hypothetical protein
MIAGLGVLFGKLQQGVQENQQMLTIARMRAEAEDLYGMKLGEITSATDRLNGGFSRDDGASVKKVGYTHGDKLWSLTLIRLTMEYERRWRRQQRTIDESRKVFEILSWRPSQDGVMPTNPESKIHKTICQRG